MYLRKVKFGLQLVSFLNGFFRVFHKYFLSILSQAFLDGSFTAISRKNSFTGTTGLNELRTKTSLSEKLFFRMFTILQRFSEAATERYSKKRCY